MQKYNKKSSHGICDCFSAINGNKLPQKEIILLFAAAICGNRFRTGASYLSLISSVSEIAFVVGQIAEVGGECFIDL